MDKRIFLGPQGHEIVYYPENEIPLCAVSDLIDFDDEDNNFDCEDPQYFTIEGEANALLMPNEVKQETTNMPLNSIDIVKCNQLNQKSRSTNRWVKKEVQIITLESQFKVVMWAKEETEDERTLPNETEIKIEPDSTVELSSEIHPVEPTSAESATTVPLYTCSFKTCQKSFKAFSTLRKHMYIHGPRTFICAECGKSFVEGSKLKRHHLVHTGEKPFQCWFEGCGKRFSLDFNLRTHVRIHTGVRPFVCPVEGCEKSFAQSTNLKSHVTTHAKPKKRILKNLECASKKRG